MLPAIRGRSASNQNERAAGKPRGGGQTLKIGEQANFDVRSEQNLLQRLPYDNSTRASYSKDYAYPSKQVSILKQYAPVSESSYGNVPADMLLKIR